MFSESYGDTQLERFRAISLPQRAIEITTTQVNR